MGTSALANASFPAATLPEDDTHLQSADEEGECTLFKSPTWGLVSLRRMLRIIEAAIRRMRCDPVIAIGTDSQPHDDGIRFVCAVTAYFPGKGGIYFYRIENTPPMALTQRLFREATLSLETAEQLRTQPELSTGLRGARMRGRWEIHVDLGGEGKAREILPSVVGMIRGSGYTCRTKPDAFGASKVADRHSK